MAKLSELEGIVGAAVDALSGLPAQLEKVKAEVIAALSDVEIPAAALEKLNALSAIGANIKKVTDELDALNPDKPTEPPA